MIVVKVGGEVVDDAAHLRGLCRNIRALRDRGADVVVVHGGGPQVTRLQEQLGQKATRIAGQRVTGTNDVFAVVAALCGTVNVALVAALHAAGVSAFGGHGASIISAHKRPAAVVAGHGVVDYGEVGDVADVDAAPLLALCAAGLVPVIATLGLERETGRVLNINGDTAAAAVARALPATRVLLVTAVGGVRTDPQDPTTLLPTLTAQAARAAIENGTISGGMVPKVEEALALLGVVDRVAIVAAYADGAFADDDADADADAGRRGTVLLR